MSTPRMTEQELAECHRRMRISKSKARVRSSTDARRTTRKSGSSFEAAIQQTGSQRGELASSPTFAPFELALTGQLPSGKNQVQLLFRKGEVHKYPNKTFTHWRRDAAYEIHQHIEWHCSTLITTPVHLTVEYWPGDKRTRDVSGQLDALFHLLVYAKVLKDDGLIYNVTWRRHAMSRTFPKVVMEVAPWHD